MRQHTPITRSARHRALAVIVGLALVASAGLATSSSTSTPPAAAASTAPPAPVHQYHDELGGAPKAGRTFRVVGDQIIGQPRAIDRRIWTRFTTLIPAEQRSHVRSFTVEPGDEGAYVAAIGRRGMVWQLGVSGGLARDAQELDYVLLHEFGHLLTLKAEQVPPQQGPRQPCRTYNPGEGCALPQSYIAQYFNEFWRATGLAPQWGKVQRIRNADRRELAMQGFYERNQSAFITDYATSTPAEDVAESFAHFVTEAPNTDQTVAGQKVRFFERFPELVALRAEIRQRAGLPV